MAYNLDTQILLVFNHCQTVITQCFFEKKINGNLDILKLAKLEESFIGGRYDSDLMYLSFIIHTSK